MSFSGNVYAEINENATNLNINRPTDDPVYYYEPVVDENGNVDYYHYPIMGDPNYITDASLFGQYDENENTWINAPLFDYEKWPGMSAVKEAAMKGDYELAKQELLTYYRSVADERNAIRVAGGATTNTSAKAIMESLARNIYPCNFISAEVLDIATVPYNASSDPADWDEVSVDVTYRMKTAVATYNEVNFFIGAVDRYATEVQIAAKESGYSPVLTMTVNGVKTEFAPTADFYMRGGQYSNNNYGSDEIMRVEEHGGYQTDTDDTKRAMILFDITDVPNDAVIADATLTFRARTTQQKYPKEISLLWYKNTSFIESESTFSTVTDWLWWNYNDVEAWDYVTPPDPNNKGKPGWHRQVEAAYLSNYYFDFGDERYAYHYLRHLVALSNSIGNVRGAKECMNQLDYATTMQAVTLGILRCINSQYMTPEVFTTLFKQMYIWADNLVDVIYGTQTNNWATFATSGVYRFLVLYREVAEYDDWLKKTQDDNARVIGNATWEDGLCIELSVNYVSTILGTFETPFSDKRTSGSEDSPVPDEVLEDIHNTLRTLMLMHGPYGGFNQGDGYDTYNDVMVAKAKTWYQNDVFDDEVMDYWATNGTEGKLPENPTVHYPSSKKTFMRSGWGQYDTMLAFTNNNKVGSSHGHWDCLSFSMFAYGRFLLVDPGYGSVQTGNYQNYNRSPVQHNLVTVNDIEDWLTEGTVNSMKTLAQGEGYELGFEANMQYDFCEYGTELYTTSQDIRRSILFLKDANFFIVSDYAVPTDTTKENLFAQHWHLYPGSNLSWDENNYTIRSNFEDDVNIQVVPVEYGEIDEVREVGTLYSEVAGSLQNSKKAMILKTKEGAGRFTTVLMPVDVGGDVTVEAEMLSTSYDPDLVSTASILVTDNITNESNSYIYFHLNDETQKKSFVTLGDITTDATTLLIQKNATAKIVSVFMMNGSYVKDSTLENQYIIKTKEPVKSLSFKYQGQNVNLASTSLTDEEVSDMTIYSYGADSVYYTSGDWNDDVVCTMTGNTLLSKKQGGYFYFGENPVLDVEGGDDDNGTSGDQTTERPGAVSGGGGGGGTVKPPKEDDPDADNNLPATGDDDTDYTLSYGDVKDTDWFYKSVSALTKKGIVSGDGDGNFRPDDKVTREQFAKLLLLCAGIDADGGLNMFDDVVSGSWYEPFVTTARKLGITSGISDSEFGVGMSITRQDMAVLIYNLLNTLMPDLEIDGDGVSFSDISDSADYAREAVSAMSKLGIIKGYDGKFRPADTLTRAEAASVIEALNNFINIMLGE